MREVARCADRSNMARPCSLVCCAAVIVAPSCWRNIPVHGVIRYQCSGYLLNRDRACCVMFGGLRADRLVSEQLLQCLTPFGIEAAIEAIETLQGASDERIQQKALALEHAHYEVTRARRQYDGVDPANRLVAAELERRWNQALTTEAQLEAELATLQQGREAPTQRRAETGAAGPCTGSPQTLG